MRLFFNFPNATLPLFVDSIGYRWHQHPVNRPQGYPYYHWLQSDKGSGEIQINGTHFTLHAGQGVLIAANIPHAYRPLSDYWTTSYFTFGGTLVREITAALGFYEQLIITQPSQDILNFTRQRYLSLANQVDHVTLRASSDVYGFLLMLQPFMLAKVNNPNTAQVTKEIIALIHARYSEELNNADFAAACNYSIQYILRTFHNAYDVTPHQYLTTYRVQKVKELLITQPKLALIDIAATVGFTNENYLIRVFKQHEGMTPGQFRAMFN